MTPQLFLCHSSRDRRFATRLARDLEALGIPVWYDQFELEVGDSLHGSIAAAISASSYVAVLVSPDSLASRWCQAELSQALAEEKRTGGKKVLPLLYRNVTPPPVLEDRRYIHFSRSYWKGIAQLAAFLFKLDRRIVHYEVEERSPNDAAKVLEILESSGLEALSQGMFRGSVRCSVKDGILQIPSFFSGLWDSKVYICSFDNQSMAIYPLDVWRETEERLAANSGDGSVQKLISQVVALGQARAVSGYGRVILPERLLQACHVEGRAVLAGQIDHVSLWSEPFFLDPAGKEPLTEEDFRALGDLGV